jgi:hypothetical protein
LRRREWLSHHYDRMEEMMSRKKSEPVGMGEVKDAVLAMLVERFDGRMLTWQVAAEGLALAASEIKQTALWRRPG